MIKYTISVKYIYSRSIYNEMAQLQSIEQKH